MLTAGALAAAGLAQSQPVTTKSAVRIVVRSPAKPGEASAASGFLWQKPNQVVTSLHAMTGSEIKVMCGTKTADAAVSRVHEESDLVLLTAAENLGDCTVFNSVPPGKPVFPNVLYTYGFHAGARGGTSREMTKQLAENETLEFLLAPPVKGLMAQFNIPSVTLPIYYVQGGLLPGYSGAPVVNANGQLVGIVDGGLNKGQDSYNWVIPAENLNKLMQSTQSTVPAKVLQAATATTGQLFAAGLADDEALRSVAQPLVQEGRTVQFVKTKTMSSRQLAETASDPVGWEKLMMGFGAPVRAGSGSFDIYEDPDGGIIIAVPVGQTLVYETPTPGYSYLKTSAVDAQGKDASWNGYVQFEVMGTERVLGADYNDRLTPAQLAQRAQDQLLQECRTWTKPAPQQCQVDGQSVRTFNFGQGRMLIKIGILTRNKRPVLDTYDYYSFAIKGDKMLRAYSRVQWTPGQGEGLIECSARGANCKDLEGARTQFANLMAANLTTFTNLGRQIRQ